MLLSGANRVGVCSWSLRPRTASELAEALKRLKLRHIQLALDPIREGRPGWGEIETINALRAAGVTVISGMMGTIGEYYSTLESIARTGGVRPDQHWGGNLRAAQDTARLARRLGLPLVTLHAGFIPHHAGPERRTMIDRLRSVADQFDACGVRIGFETGQESAETLLEALGELNRPHVGINFDPANMILYGMGDPVDALNKLASRIMQIHIKDAAPTRTPGQWGQEVRTGTGAVNWPSFFAAVRNRGLAADLVIEREAGEAREPDIVAAVELLARAGFGGDRGGPWHE